MKSLMALDLDNQQGTGRWPIAEAEEYCTDTIAHFIREIS